MYRCSSQWAPLALLVAALSACPSNPPTANGDTTAPTVKSISPSDGAASVSPATDITVRFSENVKADSVKLHLTVDGADVPGALSVNGDTATFVPETELAENVTVQLLVEAGYQDDAGNEGEEASAQFTTAFGLPTVTDTTPADGATNVPVDTVLSARFSEPLDAATVTSDSFTVKEGENVIAGTVGYDDAEHVVSFTPSRPLLESHTYVATLTTAIKDRAGNALAAAKTWSFATAATVPTVVSISPNEGATEVAGNAPIRVVFSEEMDEATLNDATFVVQVQGGATIPGTYLWESASHTAAFQPNGAYPGGAVIEVKLTTGIKDVSGIALAQEQGVSFTISNAPSVAASIPSPNAVDVALSSQVSLTFSQPMDVATLNNANIQLLDGAMAQVAGTYVPTAASLTIAPSAPLTESTEYTVVVTTNVKSATGVAFAEEYRFTFATVGIAPAVVAVTPAAGAKDVPVAQKIRLTFSEDMDTSTFTTSSVKLSNGAADVSASVTAVDARNVELSPASPLLETSSYTVIATTDLRDVAGNALETEFRSSFVTEPLPRIVSITPAQNAQNVSSGSAIVLVANKALDASTVTITPVTGTPANTVTLYEDGIVIEGAISWDPTTRAIRITRATNGSPSAWTSGKRYLVHVNGAMLEDLNGNALGSTITATFVAGSNADTIAPVVSSISPQNGQTGVARLAQPYALFSEDIDPTSLSSANVSLKDGLNNIAGRIEYVQAQQKIIFIPDQALPANKPLTFTVGAGIRDASGNQKAAANVVTFTTQDNTEPQLIGISPADAATDVNANRAIRMVFNEPVDRTTLDVEVKDGTTVLAGTTSYDDATRSAVFTPAANWPGGKAITVTIKTGLADKEGKATTADVVRSFNTIANSALDIVKPQVSATSPANAATGISARPAIQLAFSEPLDPTTVAVSQFVLEEQSGSRIPFGLSFDAQSDTATLTPSVKLGAGKTIVVKVLGGLKDLGGNAVDAMAASSSFSFTVDGAAPTITARTPVANSTVGASSGVELVFSEDMDASSIDASSFTLKIGSNPVLTAVWYEPSTRTAYLRPAARLTDATYTAALDGMRVADVAGNKVADSYGFTVSTASPSVVSVSACGQVIDPDNFGNTVVTLTFDPAVKKTGGGALDGSAIQLKANGTVVAATVAHTQGSTTATITPNAALNHSTTYEVFVEKAQVQNATTSVGMSSSYSCTFETKKVLFDDKVDPPASGWSNAASGTNQWIAVDSSDDNPGNTTQVWRGGSTVDGSVYNRTCSLTGGAAQTVKLERTVNLFGVSTAELRFDARHDIGDDPQDAFRIVIEEGGVPTVLDTFSGTQTNYQRRTYDLTSYVNKTVKIRFELFIDGGNTVGCAARKKGAFVDNLAVVGQ